MYEDNPQMHIEDLLEETLFPGSTLGWNIAGPREVIRKVTREQLIAYRDAYYIPSRLTVVVAGKIHPRALSLLQKTFGAVTQPEVPRDKPFEPFTLPKMLPSPLAFQKKQTEQVQMGMAFYGMGLGDDDRFAASLLGTILGGSMSSRLFVEVRERRGLCYSISASHQALEDVGIFSILSGLDRARLPEAVQTIFTELQKVRDKGVSVAEVRRAKDHLRGKLTLAFEDSSVQADWYGKQWMFRGQLETPDARLRKLERVTPAHIQRVAQTLFRPERMASAVIGPFANKAALARLFVLR